MDALEEWRATSACPYCPCVPVPTTFAKDEDGEDENARAAEGRRHAARAAAARASIFCVGVVGCAGSSRSEHTSAPNGFFPRVSGACFSVLARVRARVEGEDLEGWAAAGGRQ